MADAYAITLHALGAEASDDSGSAVDIGALRSAVLLTLTVTAITSGTTTVYVDTSPDGSTGWRQVGSFDAVTAIGQQTHAFDQCGRYVRARWDLDASTTFSIAGEAHQVYATRGDLTGALNDAAIASVNTRIVAKALIDASVDAEDAIANSRPMPLTSWPLSVSRRVAAIAVYLLMHHRGFRANEGIDELIVKNHDDAQAWLRRISDGRLKPPGLIPEDNHGVHLSSGNRDDPTAHPARFSDDWGDFG